MVSNSLPLRTHPIRVLVETHIRCWLHRLLQPLPEKVLLRHSLLRLRCSDLIVRVKKAPFAFPGGPIDRLPPLFLPLLLVAALHWVLHLHILEVGVLQALGSGGSLVRVELEHLVHEVNGFGRSSRNQRRKRLLHEPGEVKVHLRSKLIAFRPLSLRGSS